MTGTGLSPIGEDSRGSTQRRQMGQGVPLPGKLGQARLVKAVTRGQEQLVAGTAGQPRGRERRSNVRTLPRQSRHGKCSALVNSPPAHDRPFHVSNACSSTERSKPHPSQIRQHRRPQRSTQGAGRRPHPKRLRTRSRSQSFGPMKGLFRTRHDRPTAVRARTGRCFAYPDLSNPGRRRRGRTTIAPPLAPRRPSNLGLRLRGRTTIAPPLAPRRPSNLGLRLRGRTTIAPPLALQ